MVPGRVFDVQIAAGLVGFGYPLSLGNLVYQALRISLLGGETRTDWRRRPLSEAQLRYALEDVRHLLDLADKLGAEAEARLGRVDWAEDEFATRSSTASRIESEEERWRKLSGLHMLNRRGSGDGPDGSRNGGSRTPGKTNRPLRSVLRDDLLVAIARRPAGQPARPRGPPRLQPPQLLTRANEILGVIAAAQAVAAEALPESRPSRHDDGPGLAMVVSLLSATLSQVLPRRSKVAVGLAGGSSDLKELVRWYLDGQDAEPGRPSSSRGGGPRSAARPARRPLRAPGAPDRRPPRPRSPSPSTRSPAPPRPARGSRRGRPGNAKPRRGRICVQSGR